MFLLGEIPARYSHISIVFEFILRKNMKKRKKKNPCSNVQSNVAVGDIETSNNFREKFQVFRTQFKFIVRSISLMLISMVVLFCEAHMYFSKNSYESKH